MYGLLIRAVVCLDTMSVFYIQLFRKENYHLDSRLLCTFAHVNHVSMRAKVKTVEQGVWVSKERRREEASYKERV